MSFLRTADTVFYLYNKFQIANKYKFIGNLHFMTRKN